MKTLIATLLATAASSSFAFAPTFALNHDVATYRNVSAKAAADYKTATAQCGTMSANAKDVCMEEAKAVRAHAEADAVAQYNNTDKGRAKARKGVADADYALAKVKCNGMTGADKDGCLANADSVHVAALADVKADKAGLAVGASGTDGQTATGTTTTSTTATTRSPLIASTNTKDPVKAEAVDKCAQASGSSKTACLVDSKGNVSTAAGTAATTGAAMANRTETTTIDAADKTRSAASTAVEKTKEMAHSAAEKTKAAASTVAQKTENAIDNTRAAASRTATTTDRTADHMGDRAMVTTTNTTLAASDTAITTKVKASIFAEPELKSMGIHVETEKGVVMLSGFVNSKAEADKAVKAAKSVEGVSTVKSAIKVK